jgi:hypothetical protein
VNSTRANWRFLWKSIPLILLAAVGLSRTIRAAAPALKVQRAGTNVVLEFTGWLQHADQVNGPYTNVVPASRSPFSRSSATGTREFWRAWWPGVKTVAAGFYQTVAIKQDGSL